MTIWYILGYCYIFPHFGILHHEKSGNRGCDKVALVIDFLSFGYFQHSLVLCFDFYSV
jgi:hypothetical protein